MVHRWLSACLGKGEIQQWIFLGFAKSAALVSCTDYLFTRTYFQLYTTRFTTQCLKAEPPYVVNSIYDCNCHFNPSDSLTDPWTKRLVAPLAAVSCITVAGDQLVYLGHRVVMNSGEDRVQESSVSKLHYFL